ncbi:BUD13 homolog [Photinus pyralis]|uniref:BUD13 homolog n=1 Tax=Photinus pyralis TaxID=7054 RepID=UPI001266ED38|nr:BUD13 homolog [Photinus pyralis]
MEVMNQKEYLKKYLSGNKDKKKKKRRKDFVSDRVKIIDDDVDLSKILTADNDDLYGPNEDAPQIVGVIDDRPMHMRIDDYTKSNMWRPLGAAEDPEEDGKLENLVTKSDREIVLTFFKNESKGLKRPAKAKKAKAEGSPPRKGKGESRWDMSSREKVLGDTPPREDDPDMSPPRRAASTDMSPPRKARRNSDTSPPRKSRDMSPPRRRRRVSDHSPPRRSGKRDGQTGSPRHKHRSDREKRRREPSPPPPRRKLLPGDKKGKYLIPAKRMEKTLDGKKAGLQNAQELVKENQEFRTREDELFKRMSAETTGANAATVVRDRKTGKVRDLEKEAQERSEKERQEEANKEKYMRWGKGLKQVEDYESKLQDALQEMNKPFARYADDEDLERHLKEQEREGDPMLDYIRKKRRKNDIDTGKPVKLQFEGEFMPNRFGIRPGHRWDGVNRSNGYEKKWIEVQNTRNAIQEEVYKWSTEDM